MVKSNKCSSCEMRICNGCFTDFNVAKCFMCIDEEMHHEDLPNLLDDSDDEDDLPKKKPPVVYEGSKEEMFIDMSDDYNNEEDLPKMKPTDFPSLKPPVVWEDYISDPDVEDVIILS